MPSANEPEFCRTCIEGVRVPVLLLVVACGFIIALLLPPIAQPPGYHNFADQRSLFGIPHGWNVLSNLAFILAGGIGLAGILGKAMGRCALSPAYGIFFGAVILTGVGSAWYHLAPGNATLVWDRLPMAAAFMSFLAIIVGEYIDMRIGRRLLLPLVLLGILSVWYWHITESAGHGDLRPYGLVQFLPLPLILLIAWQYPDPGRAGRYLLAVFVLIILSKGAELFDHAVLAATGSISGHTLKHLLAGLAVWYAWRWLKARYTCHGTAMCPASDNQRFPGCAGEIATGKGRHRGVQS
jgi:hypothetical protein